MHPRATSLQYDLESLQYQGWCKTDVKADYSSLTLHHWCNYVLSYLRSTLFVCFWGGKLSHSLVLPSLLFSAFRLSLMQVVTYLFETFCIVFFTLLSLILFFHTSLFPSKFPLPIALPLSPAQYLPQTSRPSQFASEGDFGHEILLPKRSLCCTSCVSPV